MVARVIFMRLAYPNGRPDVSNRSYPISVRFAPLSPTIIQIKHQMKTSTVIKPDFNHSTLFQVAARMEIPPLPRISKPAPGSEAAKSTKGAGKNISAKNTFNGNKTNLRIAPGRTNSAHKMGGLSRGDYKTELKITDFHLEAPLAKSVKLAADFTDWEKYPLDMIKTENGVWFTIVPLAPGNYSYRFIVDGKWCDDPHSAKRTPNPFGTANSAVEVA
jgi:Glycogen recognition site of AMP-activated protein kinase